MHQALEPEGVAQDVKFPFIPTLAIPVFYWFFHTFSFPTNKFRPDACFGKTFSFCVILSIISKLLEFSKTNDSSKN